jgi:hypothetical protein
MLKLAFMLSLVGQMLFPALSGIWPVAHPDDFFGRPGETLVVAAPGILENDELPIPVTIVVIDTPDAGKLQITDDGGFSYTPNEGFAGLDTFTYRLVWEGGSSSAVVTLHILEASTASDDVYRVYQDTTLDVPEPGVMANDFPEDPLRAATLVTGPEHGNLAFYSGGGFRYVPDPGFLGQDWFTYEFYIGSGEPSNTATVLLDVVERPTARFKDAELTVNEYVGQITIGLILTSQHDGGVARLYFAPNTANCYLANPDLDCTAQTVTIEPNQGVVEFDVTIYDDPTPELELEEVVIGFTITGDDPDIIEVEPNTLRLLIYDNDNHRPIAVEDAFTATAGSRFSILPPGGVLENDYDFDPGIYTLTAALETGPAHGELTLYADGTFSYTPEPGFGGVDTFTYRASDGFAFSAPASVVITVEPARIFLPVIINTVTGD